MEIPVAKAGWLFRQSTVLHRWKKHWFVLYSNGDLKYFESPDSHGEEDKIVVYAVCLSIKCGNACNFNPPDGRTKESLLFLMLRDGELRLCAESPDDMKAWQIALEEARVLQMGNSTPMMPGQQVVYGASGTQVMYTNTVVNPGYGGYVVSPPGTYASGIWPPGIKVMYTNTVVNPGYGGYVVSPPGTYVVPNAASPGNAVVVGSSPGQVVHVQRPYRRHYRGGFLYAPVLFW